MSFERFPLKLKSNPQSLKLNQNWVFFDVLWICREVPQRSPKWTKLFGFYLGCQTMLLWLWFQIVSRQKLCEFVKKHFWNKMQLCNKDNAKFRTFCFEFRFNNQGWKNRVQKKKQTLQCLPTGWLQIGCEDYSRGRFQYVSMVSSLEITALLGTYCFSLLHFAHCV